MFSGYIKLTVSRKSVLVFPNRFTCPARTLNVVILQCYFAEYSTDGIVLKSMPHEKVCSTLICPRPTKFLICSVIVAKYANFSSERRNLLRKSKVLNIPVKVKIQGSGISMAVRLLKLKFHDKISGQLRRQPETYRDKRLHFFPYISQHCIPADCTIQWRQWN